MATDVFTVDISDVTGPRPKKVVDDDQPTPVLQLMKFAATAYVEFGKTAVGRVKTMPLQLSNPNNATASVTLDKLSTEKGFQCEELAAGMSLEALDSTVVYISWSPVAEGAVRESMQLTLNGKGRLAVVLLGTATGGAPLQDITKQSRRPRVSNASGCVDKENGGLINAARRRVAACDTENKVAPAPAAAVAVEKKRLLTALPTSKAQKPRLDSHASDARPLVLMSAKDTEDTKSVDQSTVITESKVAAPNEEATFTEILNTIVRPSQEGLEGTNDTSSQAYKQLVRMQFEARVRRDAARLFASSEMESIMKAIDSEIERGRLAMRTDKQLHADLTQQTVLMNILLSYAQPWLRLGLETVCGKSIPTPASGNWTPILKTFIQQNVLRDAAVAAQFTRTKHGVHSKEHAAAMLKQTLRVVLRLILLLDSAKMDGLMEACLFSKTSDIKTSKAVLTAFSKEFLSGEGDIVRHLGFLGYVLTTEQTFLDEFDFTVSNLAVDLRDGMRLCRIIEALAGEKPLSICSTLRYPAVSRLQKIHNVKVAFDALEARGVKLSDPVRSTGLASRVKGVASTAKDLTPADIVEGHRDKTLALLWAAIMHWRMNELSSLSDVRQEVADLCRLSPTIATAFQQPLPEAIQGASDAVISLFQWCRAIGVLYDVSLENFTTSFADGRMLCYLIHYYHPDMLSRKDIFSPSQRSADKAKTLAYERANFELAASRVAAFGCIPAIMPGCDSAHPPEERTMIVYIAYLSTRLMVSCREQRAAKRIQRCWRLFHGYTQLKSACATAAEMRAQAAAKSKARRAASARVSSAVYSWMLHRKWRNIRASTLRIQLWARCVSARQQFLVLRQQHRLRQAQSATVIGSSFRVCIARKQYLAARHATIAVQSWVRRHLALQQLRRLKAQRASLLASKATLIAATFKAHVVRKHWHKQRAAVVTLQCAARCMAARSALAHLQAQRQARQGACATHIAAQFRGYAARRAFGTIRQAAIRIQSARRCVLALRMRRSLASQRAMLQAAAATCIAANVRAQQQLRKFTTLRNSCMVAQRFWRCVVARRQLLALAAAKARMQAAATRMQATSRGFVARRVFVRTKVAAVRVQCAWRSACARRALVHLQALRWALVNSSATAIQTAVRGFQARCRFGATKSAAQSIQRAWRAALARAVLVQLKMQHELLVNRSATVLQTAFRGFHARSCFAAQKTAAITLQCAFRCMVARSLRSALQSAREHWAATKIASFWRGVTAVQSFAHMRSAAVHIQANWRGSVARVTLRMLRAARQHKLQDSASRIGAVVRAYQAQRRFAKLRIAASAIASAYRGAIARRQLVKLRTERQLLLRSSAVKIQSTVRRIAAQARLRAAVGAAIKIQCATRSFVARRQLAALATARAALLAQSSTMIASMYRSYAARCTFLAVRSAVIGLQCAVRCRQARQTLCHLQAQRAALHQQSAMRITVVMQGYVARKAFQTARSAAVRIQSAARMHMAVVRLQSMQAQRHAACRIVSAFRMHHARLQLQQLRGAAVLAAQQRGATRIAAAFRGHIQRKQFVQLNKSAVIVQALFRGNAARKHVQAMRMVKVHAAASSIVHAWRMYVLRKQCAKFAEHVVRLQKWWRAEQSRAQFKTWLQSLQHRAASKLVLRSFVAGVVERKRFLHSKRMVIRMQARWRAVLVRRAAGRSMARAREAIARANAAATAGMTLGQRTREALDIVLNSRNLTAVLHACQNLEICTRLSEVCCLSFASNNAAPVIIGLIRSCNRSAPHQKLLVVALDVLVNVASYKPAFPSIAMACESTEVLVDLLQMFRDTDSIAVPALKLMLLLCRDAGYRSRLARQEAADHRLQSIYNLLSRRSGTASKPAAPAAGARAATAKDGAQACADVKKLLAMLTK